LSGWERVVFEVVRESIEVVRGFVATLDPAVLDGSEAKALVEDFAALERLAGAGRMLVAGRVAETGAWANDGPFRDAGAWMASVAGTSVGRAKATIETAGRLAGLPATAAALRSGVLSEVQVEAISVAATANPRAERSLLVSAATDGVRGLKQACARVEAAASTDQAERYERVRVARSLTHRAVSDVEGRIEMRGPVDLTARVFAALAPIEADIFTEARVEDCREEPGAYAFDALVRMADDSATVAVASSGSRAPATVVFRIDHTAFARGTTVDGEVCEIAGVGPVPVEIVQQLCSDAVLKAVITDGTDVLAVSHLGRTIPARMRTALEELQPECVIAGCHLDRHLEIDHNIGIEAGGPTALWNLNRLCHHHHRTKTIQNLRVVGEGTHKRLVPADRGPPAGPEP
jgi:Domain of unknown function (DUF222)